MNKFYAAVVNVPYLDMDADGKTQRTFATLKFRAPDAPFCRRRLKRMVRVWLEKTLNRKVDMEELRPVLKRAPKFSVKQEMAARAASLARPVPPPVSPNYDVVQIA